MDSSQLLFDNEALNSLEAAANQAESTRSSFWEEELKGFSFTSKGEMTGLICVGSVSKKTNFLNRAAHWLLQAPYRFLSRKSRNISECTRLAHLVAQRQERAFTLDMLRQTLSLAAIMDNMDLDKSSGVNLVIGDGYGVMTSLLKLSDPKTLTIAVNLTTPLLIDLVYARKAIPDLRIALPTSVDAMRDALQQKNIDVIAIRADDAKLIAEAPIGLAINIHSMQEMTNEVINSYFDLLRSNRSEKTAFYCCNRLYKKLYDGEEIKFTDFPWHSDDQILLDEICQWDKFEYQAKLPFWFSNPNLKQHRLAILNKIR